MNANSTEFTVSRRSFSFGAAGLIAAMLAGCTSNSATGKGSSAGSAAKKEASSERETAHGKVKGVVTDGVEVYYNVPYGKEPKGELRWAFPEAPEAWSETLDCSENTKRALQSSTTTAKDGTSKTEVIGTTDCLNLDVYTTADAKDCPVLVYVHGGNNQTGTATEIPGFECVKRAGVVYVSLDYRLGVLGFNCLPAVLDDNTTTGNFGMLDIAAGLGWVRDNIDKFGGDPNNVTVSGFSAGGRDVMAMLVSPTFSGLFDKAIAFSGGMTIANVRESVQVIAQAIAPLAVEDGKASDEAAAAEWLQQDNDEVRSYLMGIDDDRLAVLMPNAGIRMSVFPHLFADGAMLPETGYANADYVNDVPLIMLTGADEFSMFCAGSTVYAELGSEEEAAHSFASKYGSDLYRIFNTQSSAAQIAGSYTSGMYLVQVDYGNEASKEQIDAFGSFHGIFAPMMGSTNYDAIYDFSEKGYADMTDKFFAYLKNFLTSGKPGKADDVEWSAWTAEGHETLVLDAANSKAVVEVKDVFKTPDQVIEEMNADTTVSEDARKRVETEVMNGRWFSTKLDETTGTAQAVHLL